MVKDNRQWLWDALDNYYQFWFVMRKNPLRESQMLWEEFVSFVEDYPNCFERSLLEGHVTGSALVVSPDFKQVLLTHHKKLNLWLHLGGHSEGNPLTYQVALREAQEESGLTDLSFIQILNPSDAKGINDIPFDIDIHRIPERPGEPAHWHYDVRFLLQTQNPTRIVISDESADLKWFPLPEAYALTKEISMHRQFKKLEMLLTPAAGSHQIA